MSIADRLASHDEVDAEIALEAADYGLVQKTSWNSYQSQGGKSAALPTTISLTRAKSQTQMSDMASMYGTSQDAFVPFPRTSGASFCGADLLVCFGRPPHLQQMNAPTEFTPRSLSALSAYISTHYRSSKLTSSDGGSCGTLDIEKLQDPVSISSFYFNNKKRTSRHQKSKGKSAKMTASFNPNVKCGLVYIYCIECILPISKTLAESYIFDEYDPVKMCKENAAAAANVGRKDLVQTWSLAQLIADPNLDPSNDSNMMQPPWSVHPLGKRLIQSLIDYYVKTCNDVQTAAMLTCVFSGKSDSYKYNNGQNKSSKTNSSIQNSSPGNSPYHTVGTAGPISDLTDLFTRDSRTKKVMAE